MQKAGTRKFPFLHAHILPPFVSVDVMLVCSHFQQLFCITLARGVEVLIKDFLLVCTQSCQSDISSHCVITSTMSAVMMQ